ncbi:MAG: zinc ribbon domain-containing protein [Oscillibacter sp.]|nr:zinc ribbon domain-containing protein [Oscillibacter sp.]
MYCPKCGKQVPDGAAFCSSCGASLNGGSANKAKVHNGWIICLVASVLSLLWAYHLYSRESSFFDFYDYQPPYSSYEIEVLFFCGLGLVGLIAGIFGLYHENKSISNPYRPKENESSPKPGVKLTAQKLAIEGQAEFAKCSRCGMVQNAERTSCQVCGAKFINRKPR